MRESHTTMQTEEPVTYCTFDRDMADEVCAQLNSATSSQKVDALV